jgi:septum formation protein
MGALMTVSFYLASQSPRRRELLAAQGLHFGLLDAGVAEKPAAEALAGQALAPQPLPVLGADTDVVLDGRILGKPRDAEDACHTLMALSGREHEVISAVACVQGARIETVLSRSVVRFARLREERVRAYCASGEPLGKAGSYAIQGLAAAFVQSVQGSYTGIVGLPLAETLALLDGFGVQPQGFP